MSTLVQLYILVHHTQHRYYIYIYIYISRYILNFLTNIKNISFLIRVLKAPGGGCSSDSVFSDRSSVSSTCSMASSPNESRASSTSPKTPSKKYHMKSNFELGDEQPDRPINTPTRRPYKPSGNFNLSFLILYCNLSYT